MIKRIDGSRDRGHKSVSPTKRPRRDSVPRSATPASSDDELEIDHPLTEMTLRSVIRDMAQQIRNDIAAEFTKLRAELSSMGSRIQELENHIERRDNFIDEIENRLRDRESRVEELEEEIDKLSSEHKKRDLIFSGPAIPAPPERAWAENVRTTTVTMLARCLPGVTVAENDIEECFRISRGKRILCRFRSSGKDSVRDRLYESRFSARSSRRADGGVTVGVTEAGAPGAAPPSSASDGADQAGSERRPGGATGGGGGDRLNGAGDGRTASTQLFVSENLTRRKQEIFQALLAEKRAQRLYTVFTKNGEVFCKTMQFGRKIRVDSLDRIANVLHQ